MAVTSIEITNRELLANGRAFGETGPYELLTGILRFAVDPESRPNQLIADLKLAPRDSSGRANFNADFALMRPVDRAEGSRRLVFEVVNRGNRGLMRRLNNAETM